MPRAVKITGSSFGSQSPEQESVDLLVHTSGSVRGTRVEHFGPPRVLEERDRGNVLLDETFAEHAGLLYRETFGPNSTDLYNIDPRHSASAFRIETGHLVFSRTGGGSAVHAVLGDARWDNVRVRASLRFEVGEIGLALRYHGYFDDHYWFRLKDGLASFGRQSLVLWHEASPIVANRTYQVELLAFGARLTGLLDGRHLFTLDDGYRADGRVALTALGTDPVLHFENLEVESLASDPVAWVADGDTSSSFLTTDQLGRESSLWTAVPGGLARTAELGPGATSALALLGSVELEDLQIAARVSGDQGSESGLLARVTGALANITEEQRYYAFVLDLALGKLELRKRSGGATTVLRSIPWAGVAGTSYNISLTCDGPRLTCCVNGVAVIEEIDSELTTGAAGFWSAGTAGSTFEQAVVLDRARRLGQWRVRDAGAIDGPSLWQIRHGRLIQRSRIRDAGQERYGTQVIAGELDWTDYRLRVGLSSDGGTGAIGVVFRFSDDRNYYRFSMDRSGPTRRLDRVVNGVVTTLISDDVPHPANERMTVTVDAIGARLRVYVGAALVFDQVEASHPAGMIGLYAHDNDNACFDEVEVEVPPLEAFALFRDRFREGSSAAWQVVTAGNVSGPAAWSAATGVMVQSSNVHSLPVDAASLPKEGTLAIAGDSTWADLAFETRLRSSDDDAIGIVFRYVDSNNYYRLSMARSGTYRRLVKKVNGTFTSLWTDAFTFELNRSYHVSVILKGSMIRLFFDGVPVACVVDPSHTTGRIGLYAWRNPDATFSDVRVYPVSLVRERWQVDDDFTALDTRRWSFVDSGTVAGPSVWQWNAGDLVQSSLIRGAQATPDRGTHAICQEHIEGDSRVSVRLRTSSTGPLGFVFRYQSESAHYRLSAGASPRFRRLVKRVGAVQTVLWQDTGSFVINRTYVLTIDAVGDRITGYLNGEQLFTVVDNTYADGKVGLYSSNNGTARFEEIRVAEMDWSTYFVFRGRESLSAGQRIRIESAPDLGQLAVVPGVLREHLVRPFDAGRLVFPASGALLRVSEPDGSGGHARLCLPDAALTELEVDVLRARDGSGLMVIPSNDAPLVPGTYRVELRYRRTPSDPEGAVLSENGETSDEIAVLEIPVS